MAPVELVEVADQASAEGSIEDLQELIIKELLLRDPEWLTDVGLGTQYGVPRHGQLTDVSLEYQRETADLAAQLLADLRSVDRSALTPDQLIAIGALDWFLDDLVQQKAYLLHDSPVNFITGVHTNLPEFMGDIHPLRSVDDAEDYLSRLEQFDSKLDQVWEGLDARESDGVLPNGRSIQIAIFQARGFVSSTPERNGLVVNLNESLRETDVDETTRRELVTQAEEIIQEVVYPAYWSLIGELENMATRSADGVWSLPDGDAYYEYALRHHLSANLSPQRVHELGLAAVDRVRAEMATELESLGYDVEALGLRGALDRAVGDAGVLNIGSSTAKLDVLEQNRKIVAAAESAVVEVFDLLPTSELDIVRPPPHREGAAGAWYRPPPLDGSRPGIYYLALGGSQYPTIGMKTTAYHEAIPGHHFQLGIQAELDAATHQKVLFFAGYGEGWALYAERLAAEIGLYDGDLYGNVGRLRMEMLRAVRAVADTGIHHLRWTRSQAIDYLMENTGFDQQRAAGEVDRYIVWPGQAPAYVIGQELILELREKAKAELGDQFDLAAFHTAVLAHGSIPLDLVDEAVDLYIETTLSG